MMPLLAHAGEMVLPRELSQGLQRMISGGSAMESLGARLGGSTLGGQTFQNYSQRMMTINQTNNVSWSNPSATSFGQMRDTHDRMTGDLVKHFTSAIA
jgi:hypothetical protein